MKRTFRKDSDKLPEKINFSASVRLLEDRAGKVNANLEFERAHKPLPIRDSFYWLRIPPVWVVCFYLEDQWQSFRTKGSYWEGVLELPLSVREVHVFRATGDYFRYYKRMFNYFKVEDWDIRLFAEADRQALFKILNRGMRQKISA